jgi:hypothetical protein
MIGHRKRLGATVAALATAACLGALTPTPAQAAAPDWNPVYWTFKNTDGGNGNRCLTGGKIDDRGYASAFMSTCNRSNFQQWDWRGNDSENPIPYKQLQNKATGLCLTTDYKRVYGNAVWLSKCDWVDGERFNYDEVYHYLQPHVLGLLHTVESGAVYNGYDGLPSENTWVGRHT